MRKVAVVLLSLFLFPVSVFAAQVFGSLRFENRSVGEGVEIRVRCGDKGERGERSPRTDRFGSYSEYLPAGKCTFQVLWRGEWSMPYDIYADQSDPVRYDFELVRIQGQLRLERK